MRCPLYLILFLFSAGCEEASMLRSTPEDTGLLVVEGIMTNENKNHLIKLSLPYKSQNGMVQPATGATILVSVDSESYLLTESPAGSGNYYTPIMRAVTGKTYTLIIHYNGKEFSAQDSPVPVQPLRGLKYEKTEPGYQLILDEEGDDPNYIDHVFSWETTSGCVTGTSCSGRMVYYDLKTIDANEIFKSEKELFYFPAQTTVTRRKYSVSAGYRAFLRSMLSETEWRGGAFDVERSNVPTNLSVGAVGFFATCSVVSDVTVIP